jgi:hypothetical protein
MKGVTEIISFINFYPYISFGVDKLVGLDWLDGTTKKKSGREGEREGGVKLRKLASCEYIE